MKAKLLFITALAVAALSACSKDSEQNLNSERPVFSGVISGINTRAVDKKWNSGNTIGITAGDGTSRFNIPYVVSTEGENGSFSPKDEEDFISFSSNKPETFIAYFPYSPKMEDVATDSYYIQNEDKATSAVSTDAEHQGEDIDFLWSSAVASSLSPNANFVFKHVMSQITLRFTKGNVSSLKGLNFTLGGLTLEGTFDVMSGEAKVAESDAENINLEVGSDVDDNTTTTSKSAIFFPQDVSAIELTVTLGSSNYIATLELPSTTNKRLLAGYNVEYAIEVNKSSLKMVASGSIIGWNSQAGDYSTITKYGDHSATEAQIYDLAMSDGTFISVWGSGQSDATTNIGNLSETQLANVVGIVYWLSSNNVTPITYDKVLKSEHSNCDHGYILALKELSSGEIPWQDKSYDDCSVALAIKDTMSADFKPSEYDPIEIEYGADNTSTLMSKALGYNNTKLLRAYNYYFADYNHKVRPIEYLDLYSAKYEAPKGSSGWYLPSSKELFLINKNLTDIEACNSYGEQTQLTNIIDLLSILNGKGIADYFRGYYWSSSECKYTYGRVYWQTWYVNFNGNRGYGYVDRFVKNHTISARAVCAF